MYRLRPALALALSAALLAFSPTEGANAQRGKSSVEQLDLEKVKSDLQSGDQERMLSALEAISKAGEAGQAAAPHVEALLGRGASTQVVVRALDVAGLLAQQSSSKAAAPYVRHRTEAVRRAAARALARTGGPIAVKTLQWGLRSGDGVVRGICATGLGELGARKTVGQLFTALEHGVAEAAASIGKLCWPTECDRFAALLGKQPFDVMTSGFDGILLRPPAQMPDGKKIAIVQRLAKVGTPQVGEYLAGVSKRWPKQWSKDVKKAIDEAVEATGGRPEKE